MQYDFTTLPDRTGTGSAKWIRMIEKGNDIKYGTVPLSVADIEFITAPEISQGLKDYLDEAVLGYSISYSKQIEAVCNWMKKRHNYKIEPNWIVGTPGVVNAFTCAIRAFSKEGEGVIIFRPIYHPMMRAISSSNRKEVNVPLINNECNYTIDFEKFEEVAKDPNNKILLFCSPHNPVGRVWSEDELKRVAEIALKNNLIIVSDEIWNDVIFSGNRHIIMGSISKEIEAITITCTAPSKSFNIAGLMCSNIIIANDDLREKFNFELDYMHSASINALGYKACELAYNKAEDWLDEMIGEIEKNNKICEEFFYKYNIPYSKAEGTFLFWADLNSLGLSGKELEDVLEENNFYCSQGYTFGSEGEGFIRLNIALPSEYLKIQLERISKLLERRL